MSNQFQEPDDVGQYAKVTLDELRREAFRPRRRPNRAGLLVLLALVFFVVTFFILAAVCDPGDEKPPGPAPFGPAAAGLDK